MWRKAMVYLGLQDDDEFDLETYDDDVATEAAAAPARERVATRPVEAPSVRPLPTGESVTATPTRPSVIRTMPSVSSARVHVVEPHGFNDAQEVGDRLKANQPVIVNMQGVDRDLQRRLIDFSSGLAYALGGSMSRVADQVFLLTPTNVEVSDEEKERLQAKGLYHA
ncbi:MAG: cell division protein SepF [Acidimicrobiia bacterium]